MKSNTRKNKKSIRRQREKNAKPITFKQRTGFNGIGYGFSKGPFPLSLRETTCWKLHGMTLNSGASSFNFAEFKINSPYDIESAAGGSSPSGWVKLMEIYGICKVLTATVVCEFVANELDQNMRVGMIFNDTQPSLSLTTYDRLIDAYEIRPIVAGPRLMTTVYGKTSKVTLKRTVPIWSIMGNKDQYLGDSGFSCPATGDPSQLLWVMVAAMVSKDGTTMPLGVDVDVTIYLDTKYFSLRDAYEYTLFEYPRVKQTDHRYFNELYVPPEKLPVRPVPQRVRDASKST